VREKERCQQLSRTRFVKISTYTKRNKQRFTYTQTLQHNKNTGKQEKTKKYVENYLSKI
jgi:hypothetical protein